MPAIGDNRFRDGECDRVPEERIREIFGNALKVVDDLAWRLSYGRNLTSDVYLSRRDDGPAEPVDPDGSALPTRTAVALAVRVDG